MRIAARTALAIGALGSITLMGYAGRRQESLVLLALFTGWVLSPFAGLALADRRSAQWPTRVQLALQRVMIGVAVGSLAAYGVNAVTASAKAGFIYLVVPLATWLVSLLALAVAARRSRD